MSMKLRREDTGVYVTEDGRYEVSKSWASTDCYDAHPVQIGREVRVLARDGGDQPENVNNDAWFAARMGKKGYRCEGGAEHWYVSWGVWNRPADDYVAGGEHFDTKADAVKFLERHVSQ
jgi:hypothetical protein